jgi:hypothetical protein
MRLACLLLAAFCLMYSIWFFYDGLVAWPRENARVATFERVRADAQRAGDTAGVERAEGELSLLHRRTEMDLVIQKVLGVMFGVAALVLLAIAAWPRAKKSAIPPPLPPPTMSG